jgi:hypothetical protein
LVTEIRTIRRSLRCFTHRVLKDKLDPFIDRHLRHGNDRISEITIRFDQVPPYGFSTLRGLGANTIERQIDRLKEKNGPITKPFCSLSRRRIIEPVQAVVPNAIGQPPVEEYDVSGQLSRR